MKPFPTTIRRLGCHLRTPQALPRRHTSTTTSIAPKSRIERINARLPRFLHRYTTPLTTAPASTITSFLLLHELTAIAPLVALTAFFHYTNYLPPYISEGAWVAAGIEKFGRYFRRKGWIRDTAEERELEAEAAGQAKSKDGGDGGASGLRARDRVWLASESGVRVVVEVATAYAITKALLPLRLVGSVWATPWFARVVVVPVLGVGRRMFGRGKVKGPVSGVAGTGAVEGGIGKGSKGSKGGVGC